MSILSLGFLKIITDWVKGIGQYKPFVRDAHDSTNLFCSEDIVLGEVISTTGVIRTSAGCAWSNFIKVQPLKTYVRTGFVSIAQEAYKIHFYDKNKTYISSMTTFSDVEFTTPVNCNHIAYNVIYGGESQQGSGIYLKGASQIQSLKFLLYDEIKKVAEWTKNAGQDKPFVRIAGDTTRLCVPEDIITGQSLSSTGVVSASAGYAWSGYLKVQPLTVYVRSNPLGIALTEALKIHFFDKNKVYISSATYSDLEFTTPADCVYIAYNVIYGATNIGSTNVYLKGVDRIDSIQLNNYNELKEINGFKNLLKTNLYDVSKLVRGQRIVNGVLSTNASYAWSNYIPVVPGRIYKRSPRASYNALWNIDTRVYFFGINKEYISAMEEANYADLEFTTPSGCYFIGMNLIWSPYWDHSEELIITPKNVVESNNLLQELSNTLVTKGIGEVVKENEKYKFGYYKTKWGALIRAVYENHVVYQVSTKLRYTDKGISDSKDMIPFNYPDITGYTEITINDTFLPNLIAGSTVSKVTILKTRYNGYRTMLFTDKNQVYYSSTGVFSGFLESKIWTLEGDEYKHPSLDNTKDPSGKHYKYYMPADIGSRASQFVWFNANVWLYHEWYEGFCFANYQNPTTPDKAVSSCVFYTVDCENIYVKYMFGFNARRFKKAGTSDYINYSDVDGGRIGYGDKLNTSAYTNAYTSGLTLRSRTQIVPSAADLNPTNIFEYSTVRNVTGFSRANPAICTVDDAADIEIGDVVLFGGNASDAEWNSLRNTTASTTVGGNGRYYMVTAKNGLNLTLAEAIGNPNNNLPAHHIHHINDTAGGIIFGTGELYPYTWMIYIRTHWAPHSTYWKAPVRLNSSENGLLRPLGAHIRTDGKFLFASDTQFIAVTSAITVRGIALETNSGGLWIGDVSNIDDWGKFKNKLPNLDTVFSFKRFGNVLFLSSWSGITYVSFNEGDTWEHVATDKRAKTHLIGFDKKKNRFYFDSINSYENNLYVGDYIEIK